MEFFGRVEDSLIDELEAAEIVEMEKDVILENNINIADVIEDEDFSEEDYCYDYDENEINTHTQVSFNTT